MIETGLHIAQNELPISSTAELTGTKTIAYGQTDAIGTDDLCRIGDCDLTSRIKHNP